MSTLTPNKILLKRLRQHLKAIDGSALSESHWRTGTDLFADTATVGPTQQVECSRSMVSTSA
jgi:hypothetical protein